MITPWNSIPSKREHDGLGIHSNWEKSPENYAEWKINPQRLYTIMIPGIWHCWNEKKNGDQIIVTKDQGVDGNGRKYKSNIRDLCAGKGSVWKSSSSLLDLCHIFILILDYTFLRYSLWEKLDRKYIKEISVLFLITYKNLVISNQS